MDFFSLVSKLNKIFFKNQKNKQAEWKTQKQSADPTCIFSEAYQKQYVSKQHFSFSESAFSDENTFYCKMSAPLAHNPAHVIRNEKG